MSNWKYQENYPKKRWGKYSEYQDMVSKNVYQRHLQQKHTKNCQLYLSSAPVVICRFTGEMIDTALWRMRRKG